ncbi:PTS transporter subunit EIIB [Mycoplasmopsis agalactiae]|uniref:PTS transporter subunit EIIB n=1 Tax=Mycoplasmopsis agalactiae TaxID=2110 RepID=UPI001F280E1D|nr:PTS transporter subunit EIIB [Mycoplasmopsis agalactiae]MCE6115120.1 PTS transporter subunit EIIB [Mycoplasmopsis agalactiae]
MTKETKMVDTNSEQYNLPKQIIKALGGVENISKYRNCATKLRYDIVDKNLVNEDKLIESGASNINFVGDNHIQVKYGLKTVKLAKSISELRDSEKLDKERF